MDRLLLALGIDTDEGTITVRPPAPASVAVNESTGYVNVTVESVTLGKKISFRLAHMATIAYAVQVVSDHFQMSEELPTAPGRVVRMRTVLVHVAAESDWAKLPPSDQASVAACSRRDGRLLMIGVNEATKKTLADIGVQDGDVFHLYQLIDSRSLEGAYLDVDPADVLKREVADQASGCDRAKDK
jgi:hypothetical protein